MNNHESMSSDPSFVILGTDSMLWNSHIAEQSVKPSDASLSYDSSNCDLQPRLDHLLRENRDLRNALNQNNLAMKTQFENLSSWQREVQVTHENHKKKFSETKELVLKLKAENAALKQGDGFRASQSSDCFSDVSDEVTMLRRKVDQIEAEKAILVKERNVFRNECTRQNLRMSLENSSEDIKPNVNMASNLQEKAGPFQSAKSLGSLTSWMIDGSLSNPTQDLLAEVEDLKMCVKKEKQNAASFEKKFTVLQQEYKIRCDENKVYEEKIRELGQKIVDFENLKESVVLKDNLLSAALAELGKERERIISLELQLEKVTVLQNQVYVYENDYKEERAAREKIVAEKEQFAEEIRVLKARVAELEGNIPTKPTTYPSSVNSSETTEPQGPSWEEASSVVEQDSRPFECPICRSCFRSEEECMENANACLDKCSNSTD